MIMLTQIFIITKNLRVFTQKSNKKHTIHKFFTLSIISRGLSFILYEMISGTIKVVTYIIISLSRPFYIVWFVFLTSKSLLNILMIEFVIKVKASTKFFFSIHGAHRSVNTLFGKISTKILSGKSFLAAATINSLVSALLQFYCSRRWWPQTVWFGRT